MLISWFSFIDDEKVWLYTPCWKGGTRNHLLPGDFGGMQHSPGIMSTLIKFSIFTWVVLYSPERLSQKNCTLSKGLIAKKWQGFWSKSLFFLGHSFKCGSCQTRCWWNLSEWKGIAGSFCHTCSRSQSHEPWSSGYKWAVTFSFFPVWWCGASSCCLRW